MEKIRKLTRSTFFKVFGIGSIILILVKVLDFYGSSDSLSEYPDYEKEPISQIINIEEVYQKEYEMLDSETKEHLFLQTGLGEDGIEAIVEQCNNSTELLEILKQYQGQLYGGEKVREIIPLKEGDVLVSVSQRLFFYPHGHAAIVVNEEDYQILEAKSFKVGSCVSKIDRWYTIPSFVVLRLKDEVVEEVKQQRNINPAESAADYAVDNLNGLPYSLFKDLRPLADTVPEYTQCAHLVWYAYYACGLDIDENRGLIIKPKDFLSSDVFEVVQVFGINPGEILKLRDENVSYE